MKQDKMELILVFKKDIGLRNAKIFLKKTMIKYREGMDSSKGKIYFYNTGPKYILTFETESEKNKFEREYQNSKEIYEMYTPNWEIRKD